MHCFVGLALPVYFFIVSFRAKKFPSRQILTLVLRALTCMAVVWGTDYGDYQFIFLESIHILFVVCCLGRFNRFATARSLGLLYSYGLMPTLIFSLRFDESGICPVALSVLILLFSTVVHVWIRDWSYQAYLFGVRRKNLITFRAQVEARRKRVEQLKKIQQEFEKENAKESEASKEGMPLGTDEQLDFREADAENNAVTSGNKYLAPLMKNNKIMPILEVPSSDSDRSSSLVRRKSPDRQFSVRSSESYGF